MGLFNKVKQGLKDATGLGLNASEHYLRAYEKGVFLENYGTAVKEFIKAAERYREDNNTAMVQRAEANAALYELLDTKNRSELTKVITVLERIPEIEQLGSDREMLQTAPLVTELKALQLECQAEAASMTGDKKVLYAKASDILMGLGTAGLLMADNLGVSGPREKALMRAYYYGAMSDYYAGLTEVLISPSQAHDYMQKAAVRFRQAGTVDWADNADGYIENIKAKRHCWLCGREMQGRNIFYQYYPADTEEYHRKMVEVLGEDTGMLDSEHNITLCTVCGSAIEKQADIYATKRTEELREWVKPILENHEERLQNHAARLERVERAAHTH